MANKILETLEYVDECRRRGIENYNASKSNSQSELSGDASLEDVVDCVRGDLAKIGYSRPADFPNTKELILNEKSVTVNGVTYVPFVACVLGLSSFSYNIYKNAIPFEAYKRYGDSEITVASNISTNLATVTFDNQHLFETNEGDFSYIIFYISTNQVDLSKIFYLRNIQPSNIKSHPECLFVLDIKELYLLNGVTNNTNASTNISQFDFYNSDIIYSIEYIYVSQNFTGLTGNSINIYFGNRAVTIFLLRVIEIESYIPISTNDMFPQNSHLCLKRLTLHNGATIKTGAYQAYTVRDLLDYSGFKNSTLNLGTPYGLSHTVIDKFSSYLETLNVTDGNVFLKKLDLETATSLKSLEATSGIIDEIVNIPQTISTINCTVAKYVQLFENFDCNASIIKYAYTGLNEKFVQQLPGWLKDHSSDGVTRTITVGSETVAKFTEEQLAEITRKGWTIA